MSGGYVGVDVFFVISGFVIPWSLYRSQYVLRDYPKFCLLYTSHLAILDHGEAVYVEKVEAPSFIKMNTWIGRRMEVHSTAVGKSLLAYLDEKQRDSILHRRGLKKLTHHTITTVPRLLKEFERVRQLGYALSLIHIFLSLRADFTGC